MVLAKTQFNHACCALVVVLLGVTTAATAQQCAPVRSKRVLALGGGFVVAQTATIVVRSSDWWTTPTTSFKAVWDGSANKEQDGLLHAAFGYHTAQVAALAWGSSQLIKITQHQVVLCKTTIILVRYSPKCNSLYSSYETSQHYRNLSYSKPLQYFQLT